MLQITCPRVCGRVIAFFGRMTAKSVTIRSFLASMAVFAAWDARAFTPEFLSRLRTACETGLKDAPPAFKNDVCNCYVERAQKKFPEAEPQVYEGAREDVQRILTDCFAEVIARRDPSVNSRRGWPRAYRANFLAACEKGATAKSDVSAEAAKTYCECSVRETEKRFPDSLSAEKYSRHLLANAPTTNDQKAYEEVLRACNSEISGESEEVASVEYQIIRNMRKGMTRANAARRVLRGFSGYYLMLTEARKHAGAPKQNAEVERTKGLIAEAGRLYVDACSKCANTSACERDRIDALLPDTEDKLSPCGEKKAPGEEAAPPMSREEREALEKDAAPYVASAARGALMGLVASRRDGNAVSETDIREAKRGYLELCERCTTRRACADDAELILAGRAPERRPWSRAARQ